MKKLLSAMLLIVNLNCFAQPNKWFVSATAASLDRATVSLGHLMKEQGYDDRDEVKVRLSSLALAICPSKNENRL